MNGATAPPSLANADPAPSANTRTCHAIIIVNYVKYAQTGMTNQYAQHG